MPAATNRLPQSLLKELFDYDEGAGCLIWRIRFGKSKPGDVAGYVMAKKQRTSSRIYVQFGGLQYSAHVLMWIWKTGAPPKEEIDHSNRAGVDNRWDNLREATRSQNQANTRLYKNNKSGIRGVHYIKATGLWRAMITTGGKARHIGYFDSPDDAANAWRSAAAEAHGCFAAKS